MSIEVELDVPLHNPSSQSEHSQLVRKAIQQAKEIARNKLEAVGCKQAERYGGKSNNTRKPFEVGQDVWLWRPKHWKFGSRWVGPYKLVVMEGVNYTSRSKEGKLWLLTTTNFDQLKVYPVPLDKGLPIHPVAEIPEISVQEQVCPLPEVPIQVGNEPPGPRPQRLRQIINAPPV